jgi:uncharacterized protein (DUF736 family)
MPSHNFDNTNRGALFKNEDKQEDRDPLYRGQINVGGKEFWLDAWLNISKGGKKYMSLRVKPKMASEHKGGAANPPARDAAEFNDDIPF